MTARPNNEAGWDKENILKLGNAEIITILIRSSRKVIDIKLDLEGQT